MGVQVWVCCLVGRALLENQHLSEKKKREEKKHNRIKTK